MEYQQQDYSTVSFKVITATAVGKLSHVCVYGDCKKGKRGGSEYCNFHKRMGENGRRKLIGEVEVNNVTIEINAPPGMTIDPYEIDISKIDVEPHKHTQLSLGIVFVLFSFMSFIIAIQSDDGICGMLGILSFVIGSMFSLSASSGKWDVAKFFILVCVLALILFGFLIDSFFSSGGGCFGVCGLSGWGGP